MLNLGSGICMLTEHYCSRLFNKCKGNFEYPLSKNLLMQLICPWCYPPSLHIYASHLMKD